MQDTLELSTKLFFQEAPVDFLLDTVFNVYQHSEQIASDFLPHVKAIFQGPELASYPVRFAYCKHFLRSLLQRLEASNVLYCDDDVFMHILTTYMSTEEQTACTYKSFVSPGSGTVYRYNVAPMFHDVGRNAWPAGLLLTHYLSENVPQDPQVVLEFGCGIGLSLMMESTWKLALRELILTDVSVDVLQNAERNFELNRALHPSSTTKVSFDLLDINETQQVQYLIDRFHATMYIVSDIVYDPCVIPGLVSAMNLILSQNPSVVFYIAQTERNAHTMKRFYDALTESEQLLCVSYIKKGTNSCPSDGKVLGNFYVEMASLITVLQVTACPVNS